MLPQCAFMTNIFGDGVIAYGPGTIMVGFSSREKS
jgi:hypothetical protein